MRAVYPGCFDPITNGHIDIIKRASKICDELVILVMDNKDKNATYSVEDRIKMIKLVTEEVPNIKVASFSGLTTDYIANNNIDVIIRGVRNTIDYEYEASLAGVYSTQVKDVETILLPSNPKYAYLSSTVVRQHAMLSGDLSEFVPDIIVPIIKSIY